jgi:hypothetical protein
LNRYTIRKSYLELYTVRKSYLELYTVRKSYLELHTVGLAGDVNAVRHDAHFTEEGQLVLGQQAVRLVQ